MKNIQNYAAPKYNNATKYTSIADGVYECNGKFFTSLSFEQEPELGEGASPADISQYPLEDVLFCLDALSPPQEDNTVADSNKPKIKLLFIL